MFTHKNIRLFFILSTALLGYLLFLNWQQDYPTETLDPEITQPQLNTSADIPIASTKASNTSQSTTNNLDIPTLEATQTKQNTKANKSDIIQVQTDTVRAYIDLAGGDIVHLELLQYNSALDSTKPFTLLNNSYKTYIIQSGLIGTNGIDKASDARPIFNTEYTRYQLTDGTSITVPLTLQQNGVTITKEFTFHKDSYLIDVGYRIQNNSKQTFSANMFGQIKYHSETVGSALDGLSAMSFTGAALSTPAESYEKISLSDMQDSNTNITATGGWIAMLQHYFVSAWIPGTQDKNIYQTRFNNNDYLMRYISPATIIDTGSTGEISAQVYAGPKIAKDLDQAAPNLSLTVDYGWLWFIGEPIFWFLNWLYQLLGNWGLAIIILTLCIKLAFFKLSDTSYRSMAKMRKLAPQFMQIKNRYANDRAAASKAIMTLYKKEKVNPVSGCLPILVQMPVFIALYWVLFESVELRHAPFALWITDLAAKDPYFILPLVMGASMFIQQKLSPAPTDPMQAKVMKFLPIIFTVFFLWFPSGLVLYWVVNNILAIAHQYWINKQLPAQ